MQHRFNVVLAQDATDQIHVTGVADDQRAVEYRFPKAGRQIVEDNDVLAAFTELAHHMAADVAGAAGDKYSWFGHEVLLLGWMLKKLSLFHSRMVRTNQHANSRRLILAVRE